MSPKGTLFNAECGTRSVELSIGECGPCNGEPSGSGASAFRIPHSAFKSSFRVRLMSRGPSARTRLVSEPGGGVWKADGASTRLPLMVSMFRTWREARDAFDWRALDPLRLKGKSRPIAAFALDRARVKLARDRLGFDERVVSELIGRDTELARLVEGVRWPDQPNGSGRLLVGDEGSGKSRLLLALGMSKEIEGLDVLQVRASPLDRERRFSESSSLR